jgi:hypothetical protein
MSFTLIFKAGTIALIGYIVSLVIYNTHYEFWGSFDYENHSYKYSVFVPGNYSMTNITTCKDNVCKNILESSDSNITWVSLFEREFGTHINYDNLENINQGYRGILYNPNRYFLSIILTFSLFIIFI